LVRAAASIRTSHPNVATAFSRAQYEVVLVQQGLEAFYAEAYDFGRGWWIESSHVTLVAPRCLDLPGNSDHLYAADERSRDHFCDRRSDGRAGWATDHALLVRLGLPAFEFIQDPLDSV
jgi:hypothetical protein